MFLFLIRCFFFVNIPRIKRSVNISGTRCDRRHMSTTMRLNWIGSWQSILNIVILVFEISFSYVFYLSFMFLLFPHCHFSFLHGYFLRYRIFMLFFFQICVEFELQSFRLLLSKLLNFMHISDKLLFLFLPFVIFYFFA